MTSRFVISSNFAPLPQLDDGPRLAFFRFNKTELMRVIRISPEAKDARCLAPRRLACIFHGVTLQKDPRHVFKQIALPAFPVGYGLLGIGFGGLLLGCRIAPFSGSPQMLAAELACFGQVELRVRA